MKRAALRIPILALTLVLAACQDPAPSFAYAGTSLSGGVEHEITLTLERRGDRLTGHYSVDAARGAFRGTVSGAGITAELTPSPTCTYHFEGTLTDTALTGTFEPTGCSGGESGTWTLALQ